MGSTNDESFDAGQWRALVTASLKHDLRRTGRSGIATGHKGRGIGTLVILQLMIGAVLSLPLWGGMPAFAVATLHLTYLMLSVAALLVLDAQSLIVSPADYAVVAPRPVSARTFFVSRVTTVLAYVLLLAGAQSLFPVIAYFGAGGIHWGRGAGGVLAVLATTLTTAAAATALYGTVLRRTPPRLLRVILTTLQLTTSFSLYGLLAILPNRIGRTYLLEPLSERPSWLRAVPTTWAAALVDADVSSWAVTLAIAIPLVAWWAAGRWFSIDYAEQATSLDALPEAAGPAQRMPRFKTGEARAIALLARAQFRNDMRFRAAVLAILPLTIIYLIIGIGDESLARESGGHPSMVYVAVLIFPLLLKGAFARTEAYRAAWVFYATPVSAARLLLGERTVLVRWFLVPYVLAVGVLLSFLLPTTIDAVVAVTVAGLLSHLLLVLTLAIDPSLPFSSPPQVGSNTKGVFVALVPAILFGQLLPAVLTQLSESMLLAAGAVGLLVIVTAAMEMLLRWRVDRLAADVEFTA